MTGETAKSVATAPIRLAARTAERAVNDIPGLNVVRAGKGLMTPADEAAGMRIKIPGRDIGLTKPPVPDVEVTPQGPYRPQTVERPPAPPISVRRVPGEIAPETFPVAAEERIPPVPGRGTAELPGGGVIRRAPLALPPGPNQSGLSRLPEALGYRPLEPGVPLRAQPRSVGAASVLDLPVPAAAQPRPGPTLKPPLGSRVAVPIGEEFGPITKREGEFPVATIEEPARQMGAPPLEQKVPLKEQVKPNPAAPPSRQATLEERFPDKAQRQMVHANGERMVQAIGKDRELMDDVHDLTNADVRQALINSGENMGQMSIGNRKAMGSSQMTRQAAFELMLDKGLTPKEIVELAKKPL
jgi:hypothetical protein